MLVLNEKGNRDLELQAQKESILKSTEQLEEELTVLKRQRNHRIIDNDELTILCNKHLDTIEWHLHSLQDGEEIIKRNEELRVEFQDLLSRC